MDVIYFLAALATVIAPTAVIFAADEALVTPSYAEVVAQYGDDVGGFDDFYGV